MNACSLQTKKTKNLCYYYCYYYYYVNALLFTIGIVFVCLLIFCYYDSNVGLFLGVSMNIVFHVSRIKTIFIEKGFG